MLKEWTPERLSLCRRRCNYSSVPRPPPVRLAISSDDVNESPPSTPKRMRGNLNEIVNFTSFLKFSGSFHFFSLPRIKNRNNNNVWKFYSTVRSDNNIQNFRIGGFWISANFVLWVAQSIVTSIVRPIISSYHWRGMYNSDKLPMNRIN